MGILAGSRNPDSARPVVVHVGQFVTKTRMGRTQSFWLACEDAEIDYKDMRMNRGYEVVANKI